MRPLQKLLAYCLGFTSLGLVGIAGAFVITFCNPVICDPRGTALARITSITNAGESHQDIIYEYVVREKAFRNVETAHNKDFNVGEAIWITYSKNHPGSSTVQLERLVLRRQIFLVEGIVNDSVGNRSYCTGG
jgi:hypothetical protein